MSSEIVSAMVVAAIKVADVLSDGLTGARVDSRWVLEGLDGTKMFTEGVEILVAEVEVADLLPSRIACLLL